MNYSSSYSIKLIFFISLACTVLAFAQAFDPLENPLSFGDGFIDPSPESVVFNPALLQSFTQSWGSASHERLFWGIGETIHRSSISMRYSSCCTGIALEFNSLNAPIESRWRASFSYGLRLSRAISATIATLRYGLFAGATADILSRSYNPNNMTLGEPDPLFAGDNYSKLAPNLGIGFAYRQRWGEIYAGAYNLLFPDLALGDDPEKLNPIAQIGGIKSFNNVLVHIAMQYSPHYSNFLLDFDPSLGISFKPISRLMLKSYCSTHTAGIGATFALATESGLAFSYRMTYPFEGLNIPTHKFGIDFRFSPPQPIFADVRPAGFIIEGKPIPGETMTIGLLIENIGRFKTPAIPVHLVIGHAGGGSTNDTTVSISAKALKPSKSETLWVQIPVNSPGDIEISAVLNRKSPSRFSDAAFIETNPDNNFANTSTHIFAPPEPELIIDHGELHLIQKFSIAEDEPLVPLFFFESDDSILDSRFNRTIEIVSLRMSQNPDVILTVRGYILGDEPDELAHARSRAVKAALVHEKPGIAERIIISQEHDIFHLRAEKEKFQGTRLGRKYTAQENRRVELGIDIIGDERFELATDSTPSDSLIESIDKILSNNPEVILAVRAGNIPDALAYKKLLLESICEECREKMFSQTGVEENIELVLSAAGLLYRPPRVVQPEEGFSIEPEWDKVNFEIIPNSETPLKRSKITISDAWNTITEYPESDGSWNWRLPEGELAKPGDDFFISAEVEDTLGQFAETNIEKISVRVQNINEVQQRLILLQFAFAGEQSESEFSNARMELIARKVIERIEAGYVDVIITGHTDTVGTFGSNARLSRRRATEQLDILKDYLEALLSFDNAPALDNWVSRHNSRIIAKGFGMSEAFMITRLLDGEEVRKKVGVNTTPEGRIKNRRVEIIFKPRRKPKGV